MKKALLISTVFFTFLISNAQTGNVGIGTFSPLAKLHVADSSVVFTAFGNVPAQPGEPPISNSGRRMMWYPGKAAFRTGYAFSTSWNKDSIGLYSFAAGYSPKAVGNYSFAGGAFTNATGESSVCFGGNNTAIGNYSFASGYNSMAFGAYSLSIGNADTSNGNFSVAFGHYNKSLGFASFVHGENSIASGSHTFALGKMVQATKNHSWSFGESSIASGLFSQVLGFQCNATADYAKAFGNNSTASGLYSTVLGLQSNASADFSTAIGNTCLATGQYSFARGEFANAFGVHSISMGSYTSAQGNHSIALGNYTEATGNSSMAFGSGSISRGTLSLASGVSVYAKNYGCTALGLFNDTTYNGSLTSIDQGNRIFQVGNGTAHNARNNAVTVLQNGNTGINNIQPKANLDIKGDLAYRQNVITLVNGLNSDLNAGKFSFIKVIGPNINFAIDGIQGGVDGKIITIFNQTGTNMLIVDQSGSASTPVNRINTLAGGVNLSTINNGSVTLQYSEADSRWMLIAMKD
ncbi:MAG TPA: hypothetical protein PK504_10340 [Ferruginibacter sp.]|nr:hypothetical protein [Ferruginibacter sp.]HRE64889.1 hypothetical protein [Ferruginibacter sp.]